MRRHVLLVRQIGDVEHDRGEPAGDGAVAKIDRRGVVEVERDGHRGCVRDLGAGAADRLDRAEVVLHRVLAELEDDRGLGIFRAPHDSLGMLDADHVEGWDPRSRRIARRRSRSRVRASGIVCLTA